MKPILLFIVTTSPYHDWTICVSAAFLGCGTVSQAPFPESNPNSSSPVTTMVGHYPTNFRIKLENLNGRMHVEIDMVKEIKVNLYYELTLYQL